ncbi:MAG TPA: N-6 DNA methylase, partial [Solirubrobacterales bacterium]|nr:N-6 DNA methylase [Solirubrobacterales bacterium]
MLAATIATAPDIEEVLRPLGELDRDAANHLLALVGEIEEAELPEAFEWLLRRSKDSLEQWSSDTQVALLVALIGEEGGTIYDPAAGSGGFLAALWRAAAAGEQPKLFGQEINADCSKIARQRFLIGNIPASLA